MKLFVLDFELTDLEGTLPLLTGASRLHALVALSWHLRQRDTQRALALCDAINEQLAHASLSENDLQRTNARMLLVAGEAKWLLHQLDDAEALANEALMKFSHLNDALGCADAHLLLGVVACDQGDLPSSITELTLATIASSGIDEVRANAAKLMIARLTVSLRRHAAYSRWCSQINALLPTASTAMSAMLNEARMSLVLKSGEFEKAIAYGMLAFNAARATGQLRRAIAISSQTGLAFSRLNDLNRAADWMRRGLDLARTCGWPYSTGTSLVNTGRILQLQGLQMQAMEYAIEALNILGLFPCTDAYVAANKLHQDLAAQWPQEPTVARGTNPDGVNSETCFVL